MGKKSLRVLNSLLIAALCTTPAVGMAAPCSGTNINTTLSWEPIEIAEGTQLAIWRGTSVIVSDDPKAPYHLAAGECIGSYLITPDGDSRASGSCARKDKDGDVLNETWVQPVGTESKGTFKNVGGTGKFSKTVSTANWEVIMLQDGKAAVRWEGDCQ